MSNTIEVQCRVRTYEESLPESVIVYSDGIYEDRVWIKVEDRRFCVIGRQMITAIENAMRAR